MAAQRVITRILFVCHGNICRSPMAKFVMGDLVAKRGLDDLFFIGSAATSAEELGEPLYPYAREELEARGIPCDDHAARQIRRDEAADWDIIICMDDANIRNARRRLGSHAQLYKLMEFAGSSRDVADPWYTGDFATCFEDISSGCVGLLSFLGY